MSVFNCHPEMSKYQNAQVALGKDAQKTMRDRRDAGRTRLKQGLDRAGLPAPSDIISQGSYAMRTMIQDPSNDYDIDDGVYFASGTLKDKSGNIMTSAEARQAICDALAQDERLKYPAHVRENCVRQEYPEGYHIDVPIYRVINESADRMETIELASGNSWVASDARAVTGWFKGLVGDLNTGEQDGIQLRRLVRLTKKFARSRSKWKTDAPSGICLTVLVVESFTSVEDRDDEALLFAWKKIYQKLCLSLRIQHPVISGNELASSTDAKVAFFRDKLGDALETLKVLEKSDCTEVEARSAWDEVFNTSFFKDQTPKTDGSGNKGGPPVVKTSEKVPRRDDGDGRFG